MSKQRKCSTNHTEYLESINVSTIRLGRCYVIDTSPRDHRSSFSAHLMATATNSSVASTTSSLSSQSTDGSPLLKLIPYAYTTFSLVGSLLSFSLAIIKLALSPLPILLYIVAPITTFIDVTITLFIRLPYRTLLFLADAIYPLYVLFGVACITGCLFGFGGRLLVGAVVKSIAETPDDSMEKLEDRDRAIKLRRRLGVKSE